MTAPGSVRAMVRGLAEQLTHRFVFRRTLPPEFASAKLVTSTEGGLRYLLARSADFDPMLYELIRRYVRPGDVVWDIGANVGLFSFTAAARAGRDGLVLAVEADTWLVGLLRRSAQINARSSRALAPVHVLPVAISDHTGTAEFCIAKRNRSTNYLEGYGTTQTGGERDRILVPTFTIDQLLERFPAPNLLKIDVEGAEEQALAGAGAVLAGRPLVVCEVAAANAEAVHAILEPLGYTYIDADHNTPAARPPANTIAVPPPT